MIFNYMAVESRVTDIDIYYVRKRVDHDKKFLWRKKRCTKVLRSNAIRMCYEP